MNFLCTLFCNWLAFGIQWKITGRKREIDSIFHFRKEKAKRLLFSPLPSQFKLINYFQVIFVCNASLSMVVFLVHSGFWSNSWIVSRAIAENHIHRRWHIESEYRRFQFRSTNAQRDCEHRFPFSGYRAIWSRHKRSGQSEYIGQHATLGSVRSNAKPAKHHTRFDCIHESNASECRWTSLSAKGGHGFEYIYQMRWCIARRFGC